MAALNLDLSLDGVSVSTDPEDADLARHVKGLAEAGRDLADHVSGEDRQQCSQCGRKRRTRPLALQDDQGRPVLAPVCAGCQRDLAEQRMELARQQVAEDEDA